MRKTAALCALMVTIMTGSALAQAPAPGAAPQGPPMSITTTGFTDGGIIPDKFSQAVPNPVSPAFSWVNAPAGTQSFALLVHDMDGAPAKGVYDVTHWLIFNIPATATSLPEGVPTDKQELADGSIQVKGASVGYRGMGFRGTIYHHYAFELFALDTKLPLGVEATRADVMKAMDGHVLGKSTIFGLFHRQ